MIEHVWTVLCRRSVVDSDTNSISLIESVESIQFGLDKPKDAPTPAGLPLELELVTLWIRSDRRVPEHSQYRVFVQLPDESEREAGESVIIDLREFERLRARVRFDGIPFVGPGRYRFVVQLQEGEAWTTVARVPLDIEETAPSR